MKSYVGHEKIQLKKQKTVKKAPFSKVDQQSHNIKKYPDLKVNFYYPLEIPNVSPARSSVHQHILLPKIPSHSHKNQRTSVHEVQYYTIITIYRTKYVLIRNKGRKKVKKFFSSQRNHTSHVVIVPYHV